MPCACKEQWGERYTVATACIGQVWLFDDLPAPDRAALVGAACRALYAKRAAIFREGEPATQMFLIKAGRVKLSKLGATGTELTLDYRKAGDFLGETVLHVEAAYPLTATCTEDTITCGFTKVRFEALVIKPGMLAMGKAQIREAMEAIARHFNHTLHVEQAGMTILEAGDTASVLARTVVRASNLPVTERRATYVFTRSASSEWHCLIDNSYGHELLQDEHA